MDKLMIRQGRRSDLASVHKLVEELAIFEKEPESFTAKLEDYYRDYDAKIFDFIIAEYSEKIVGMAFYYMSYSTWKGRMLYLEDFVVNSEYRSMGIGQMLFDAYIAKAHELDCAMVKWQVLDWNKGAIKFYERNEAEIEKQWYNGKIIF